MVAIAILVSSCSKPGDGLDQILAEATPNLRKALNSPDSLTLDRFIDRNGCDEIAWLLTRMEWWTRVDGPEGAPIQKETYEQRKMRVRPYYLRISDTYARRYYCSRPKISLETRDKLSYEDMLARRSFTVEWVDVRTDHSLPPGKKVDRFLQLLDRPREFSVFPAGSLYSQLADACTAAGRQEEATRWLRSSLDAFEATDRHDMICQIAAVIGSRFSEWDSTAHYYNLSLELARRHDFPHHVARVSQFYANHYIREGRYALAQEYLEDAAAAYEPYPDNPGNQRVYFELSGTYRRLGLLNIADALLARAEAVTNPTFAKRFVVEPLLLQAKGTLAFEGGQYDAGERAYGAALKGHIATSEEPVAQIALLYLSWGKYLLRSGNPERALEKIDTGIDYCAGNGRVQDLSPLFYVPRAEALLEMNRVSDSRESIAEFDRAQRQFKSARREDFLNRDVVATRLAELGSEPAAVFDSLEQAVTNLLRVLARTDRGVHSVLWLDHQTAFAHLLRDMSSDSDELAYGAYLFRRSLSSMIGRRPQPGENVALPDQWRELAERNVAAVTREHAVHIAYDIDGNNVIRFVVRDGKLRRDVLVLPELAATVQRAWKLMSAPGTGISSELVGLLASLHDALIPPELSQVQPDGGQQLLLISAGGFLRRIPFETFSRSVESYRPLARDYVVAYLSGLPANEPAEWQGGSVIVAAPSLSPATVRRYALNSDLSAARDEVVVATNTFPAAVTLTDTSATVAAVRAAAESSSVIYIAAHVVRNPDAPFISFLPLAAPPSAARGSGYLDATDVMQLDLSGCSLAVLSGCSTGSPYTDTNMAAPSFGDAFIEAGAHEVVETFWDVEDTAALESMTLFMRYLRERDLDVIESLDAMKRERFKENPNPHHWAAYAVWLRSL